MQQLLAKYKWVLSAGSEVDKEQRLKLEFSLKVKDLILFNGLLALGSIDKVLEDVLRQDLIKNYGFKTTEEIKSFIFKYRGTITLESSIDAGDSVEVAKTVNDLYNKFIMYKDEKKVFKPAVTYNYDYEYDD